MRLNQRGAVLPTVLILSIILVSLSASHQVLILGRMRQLNLLKESYDLQTMEAMVLDDYLASFERGQDATYVFNKGEIQVCWQPENKLLLTAQHRDGLSRQTEYEMSQIDSESRQELEEAVFEESKLNHEKIGEEPGETGQQKKEISLPEEASDVSGEDHQIGSSQPDRTEELLEIP